MREHYQAAVASMVAGSGSPIMDGDERSGGTGFASILERAEILTNQGTDYIAALDLARAEALMLPADQQGQGSVDEPMEGTQGELEDAPLDQREDGSDRRADLNPIVGERPNAEQEEADIEQTPTRLSSPLSSARSMSPPEPPEKMQQAPRQPQQPHSDQHHANETSQRHAPATDYVEAEDATTQPLGPPPPDHRFWQYVTERVPEEGKQEELPVVEGKRKRKAKKIFGEPSEESAATRPQDDPPQGPGPGHSTILSGSK